MTEQLGENAGKVIQPDDIGKAVVFLTQLSPHTSIREIRLDAGFTF